MLDGKEWTGEFAGVEIAGLHMGRVRIGHRVRTAALSDIHEIVPPAGDRWATLHMGTL
jgi:hypothetical protein